MHAYQLNYENPILNNLLPIKRVKKKKKEKIELKNLTFFWEMKYKW